MTKHTRVAGVVVAFALLMARDGRAGAAVPFYVFLDADGKKVSTLS